MRPEGEGEGEGGERFLKVDRWGGWLGGVVGVLLLASGAGAGLRIVDRPLPFGPVRRALTLDYVRRHCDPEADTIEFVPRAVVVHWTASPTLASALAAFSPEVLPKGRPELEKGGTLNVSAHFLVDRDGTVYRLLPETRVARHAVGLNRCALGIENVGGPKWPLTRAQVEANAELVRDLKARHPSLRYLLGHSEYGKLRGTALWEERDPTYFTGKTDPGPAFLAALRTKVDELGLLAP